MGNLLRGQVSETIGGEAYVFRLATNEWASLEDEHDKTTDELIVWFFELLDQNKLRMSLLRSFFRAALIGQRPDVTIDEAGEIMSDMGLVEAGALLGRVIAASMPDPKAEDENPPKAPAKASTGRRSSKRG